MATVVGPLPIPARGCVGQQPETSRISGRTGGTHRFRPKPGSWTVPRDDRAPRRRDAEGPPEGHRGDRPRRGRRPVAIGRPWQGEAATDARAPRRTATLAPASAPRRGKRRAPEPGRGVDVASRRHGRGDRKGERPRSVSMSARSRGRGRHEGGCGAPTGTDPRRHPLVSKRSGGPALPFRQGFRDPRSPRSGSGRFARSRAKCGARGADGVGVCRRWTRRSCCGRRTRRSRSRRDDPGRGGAGFDPGPEGA